MLTINFIDEQCYVARKKKVTLISFILILSLFLIFYFHHMTKESRPLNSSTSDNKISLNVNVIFRGESINNLKLLGVMINTQRRWAILMDAHQKMKRVRMGDYVGKEAVCVREILPQEVLLIAENGKQITLKL